MKKIILFVQLLVGTNIYAQYAISSTSGPLTSEIMSVFNYSDSVIFISRKNMGVYKSTDLGSNWFKTNKGISRCDDITSFYKYQEDIFAISSEWGLYRSVNQGLTWTKQSISDVTKILSITSTPNGYIFLGSKEGLWRSTNNGNSWELINCIQWGAPLEIQQLASTSSGEIFILKSWDQFWRSSNYGESWVWVFGVYNKIGKLFVDKDDIFYSLYGTRVFRSTDLGTTWAMIGSGLHWTGSLSSIAISEDSIIFVGYSKPAWASIYRSTDNGLNFSRYKWGSESVNQLCMVEDKFLLSANTAGIHKFNFREINNFNDLSAYLPFAPITNIYMDNDSLRVNVDSLGSFSFQDAGKWSRVFTTLEDSVKVVTSAIHYPNLMVVGSSNAGIFKSTDSGTSWLNEGTNPLDTTQIVVIDGSNINNIICATKYQGLFSSSNQGMSWSKISVGLPLDLIVVNLKCFDSLYYLVSTNYKVFKSDNAGISWFPINNGLPEDIEITDLGFFSSDNLLISSNNYGVFRSSDGGQSWFDVNNGLPFNTPFSAIIHYPSSFVVAKNKIFRSTNFGDSWFDFITLPINMNITSIAYNDNDGRLYFSTNTGAVYRTYYNLIPVELVNFSAILINNFVQLTWETASELNNSGFEVQLKTEAEDWRAIGFEKGMGTSTTNNSYNFSFKISNLKASRIYFRLKQTDFDGTSQFSNIVEISLRPIKFELSQNYPNPFNPNTKISWQSPVGGLQVLKIFDVLSKEVTTLVNEWKDAGNNEVEFDASKLASGVYYYQLRVGEFIQTRKMILLR